MVKRPRTHLNQQDSPTSHGLRPKHLTKKEFGRRVYALMVKKGWHQSELARRSILPDGEHLSRDAVSKYIRGATFPTNVHLEALCKALGVEKEVLLPNVIESAIDNDDPSFEMKVSPADPRVAWLRVNRLVKTSTAVRVADLLEVDDAADAIRASGPASVQPVDGKASAS